ncbi:hypothetical protein J7T55_007205 [Diaporthe amygdali]|uniref:uncharacterized protein n=1 Tax=Phomopsis amygdali TaxID=1214568 RepID=UPI0022FF1431|nr:uncharacterized protein J7T55_007205 [Diaporthe amygdali]KAJ0108086.1 hypothetical protein J7T55_007205 [Diaporthe amygdali]
MDSLSDTRPPSPVRDFPPSGFEVVDEYEKLDEEKYAWYSVEMWYPVQIGEVFQNQYQAITKIGYGTASTSWLCRDLINHRYVALKVYCTDSQQANRETAALEHIESVLASPDGAEHTGQEFIRRLLDRFTVSNPRAVQPKPNICLVYKPMGMSLSEMATYSYDDGMPVDVVKGITMYLLAALDFLHSKANLVHTDLQDGNVMFSIESETSLQDVVEEELNHPSPRSFHKDGHIIFRSREILTSDIEYPTICDFGEARFGKDEYEEHAMPDRYRAPEILLHLPWTNKIDIWALGLMIWSMVEGTNLFRGSHGGRWEPASPHMARMVSLLGQPPQHMLDQTAAIDKFFDANGA